MKIMRKANHPDKRWATIVYLYPEAGRILENRDDGLLYLVVQSARLARLCDGAYFVWGDFSSALWRDVTDQCELICNV